MKEKFLINLPRGNISSSIILLKRKEFLYFVRFGILSGKFDFQSEVYYLKFLNNGL